MTAVLQAPPRESGTTASRAGVLRDVLDLVRSAVPHAGGRAAVQGPITAIPDWVRATGAADLDVWCDEAGYRVLAAALAHGARVQHADDPRRLRHTAWLLETGTGPAIVDVTVGDLAVGPVTLVPQSLVTTRATPVGVDGPDVPRLAGVAAAADLAVRPLLRGRIPPPARLAEARAAWRSADPADQRAFRDRLAGQLGAPVAGAVGSWLAGEPEPADLLASARSAYRGASLRGWRAAWRQRRVIVPTRRPGIAGIRARGVLVVLVGTDGAGKSTLAAAVAARLAAQGIPTSQAYLGMARGNLPGVAFARRRLGIAPTAATLPAATGPAPGPTADTGPAPGPAAATQPAVGPVAAARPADPGPARVEGSPAGDGPVRDRVGLDRAGLDHPTLRRLAAWFYAGEYLWRYLRDIRPHLTWHGQPAVVLADRYVYDLADSPWPGSPAAAFARWAMPRPDVLVVPDAPDAVIHARKPERPAAEQAAQQARYRALAAANPARVASLLVPAGGPDDTRRSGTGGPDRTGGPDGTGPDPIAPVIAAVVEAMHTPR